jgi:hypothetical protein
MSESMIVRDHILCIEIKIYLMIEKLLVVIQLSFLKCNYMEESENDRFRQKTIEIISCKIKEMKYS